MARRPSTLAKRRERRIERARKGGLALKAKYGHEHFARIGRLGGRPTWQEALVRAKAHEAEVASQRNRPGRPRNAPPDEGATKEMPADTAACPEPIIAKSAGQPAKGE